MESLLKTWASILLLCILGCMLYLYDILWSRPERLRKRLRSQGIKGPPPSFLFGNVWEEKRIQSIASKAHELKDGRVTHDYFPFLFPQFDYWRKNYGPTFVYTIGNMPILYVTDPILAKELICKPSSLSKPSYYTKSMAPLLGQSVFTSTGDVWVQHRRIMAPAFFVDKIKGMTGLIVESLMPLLHSWEMRVESEGGCAEITVDQDLKNLTADVISRACFGSSFSKGKHIFSKLKAMQNAVSKQSLLSGLSVMRYIPTETNREIKRLRKEITSLILKVVEERERSTAEIEKDFLQSILQNVMDDQYSSGLGLDFVIENCKVIYFAGHDSTAISLSWILLLLALHPDWQTRVRREVEETCGPGMMISAETLSKMKTLTMVIQETLRLYPIGPFYHREASEELKIGDLLIPKGTIIWISLLPAQQDIKLWGSDALEFRPERFMNGISGACKIPQIYVPFGYGPRVCLGQSLAMMEMKVAVAMILSRFSLSLSPSYRHCPAYKLALEPAYGVRVMLNRV